MVSEEKLLSDGMMVEAQEASEEDLLVVHTRRYLNELKVQGQGPEGLPARRSGQGRAAQPGKAQPKRDQFLSIVQGKHVSLWSQEEQGVIRDG